MGSVSLKTPEEVKAELESKQKWRRNHYTIPDVKLRQKLWFEEYSKLDYVKESHRKTQERYIKSPKGIATRTRYLQIISSKTSYKGQIVSP